MAHFLTFGADVFDATGSTTPFDATWVQAVELVLDTFDAQMKGTAEEGGNPPYLFQRTTSQPTDSLSHGRGWPAASGTGMIKTGFRPSDDAHVFPFLVPANALASVALNRTAAVLKAAGQPALAARAATMAATVRAGVLQHGVVQHPTFGTVFAYEVDGFGNRLFMDDGNIPSLLSLPFIGFVDAADATYQRTRKLVLSPSNPYFFSGSAGAGVGSPHTGQGSIWPMAIAVRILTSSNKTEVAEQLSLLVASSACTGVLHESYNENNVGSWTRAWFSWMNSLGAMAVQYVAARWPDLVF